MLNVVIQKLKATIFIFHFMLLYEFTGLFQLLDQQRGKKVYAKQKRKKRQLWFFHKYLYKNASLIFLLVQL